MHNFSGKHLIIRSCFVMLVQINFKVLSKLVGNVKKKSWTMRLTYLRFHNLIVRVGKLTEEISTVRPLHFRLHDSIQAFST